MKIIADIFPAHFCGTQSKRYSSVHELNAITTGKNDVAYLQTTRVVVTETHVTVAQDSPDGAQVVFHEPYTELYAPEDRKDKVTGTYRIVTTSGKFLAFQKDTSCGCGSRLRSWNPYKTLSSMNDPQE